METKILYTRISPDLDAWLVDLAKSYGLSRAAVIRAILETARRTGTAIVVAPPEEKS